MKNVLIPTDFSKNAWNATQYAIELFKNETCVFHLLNTYTPAIASSRFMGTISNGKTSNDTSNLFSKNGLKKILNIIQEQYDLPNHSFKLISSFSFLVDEIKEIVQENNIDLVITGTKGVSGIKEVFIGSNTVRIIKNIRNCPVMTIPQNYKFYAPREIAFATDFKRFYTVSELQPLIEMARTYNAAIHIVHVQNKIKPLTELQQFNLSMLRKYLIDVEHYVHAISELNSVSNSLEIFTNELDIHLLTMLNYQHSYMEKMTREPIIKRVAFHTQLPLMVLPELGIYSSSRPLEKVSVGFN